jgi:hypothetical protein
MLDPSPSMFTCPHCHLQICSIKTHLESLPLSLSSKTLANAFSSFPFMSIQMAAVNFAPTRIATYQSYTLHMPKISAHLLMSSSLIQDLLLVSFDQPWRLPTMGRCRAPSDGTPLPCSLSIFGGITSVPSVTLIV